MHLDWKNKCCENDHSTNLQIQCNSKQIPQIFFAQIEKLSENSNGTTKGQGK